MKYPFTVYKTSANNHTFWVAESLLLRGCVAQGETADEALNELAINEDVWLNTAVEYGIKIPEIPIRAMNEAVDLTLSDDVVEVKHGYWIDTTAYCGEFTCSICKEMCVTNKYKYCPHCGAKMDLEDK